MFSRLINFFKGAKVKTGFVENVEFTQDGAGNQWTTIDGVEYATYWDMHTKNWKVGDRVAFTVENASLFLGQPKIQHARNISKITVAP